MRKEFYLPEEDTEFLEGSNYSWETVKDKRLNWLLIHNFKIPEGYNIENATVALRIDSGYPNSQIDMVYFYPSLSRIDNKPINALANQLVEDKLFQRWSRHRTRENPWRCDLDNVSTHLQLVTYWLEREFKLK
jgi:hypothetical protein